MKMNQELLLEHNIVQSFQSPAELRDAVLLCHRKHVNSGLARLADIMGTHVEVRSAGNYVFDERGERYLDCGGYGVFTLGHGHPMVVGAVKEQLERHPLATRGLVNMELAMAAEALSSIAPKGLDYVYFGCSGTEATEAALKLSRLHGKNRLISMHGGFHGKTIGALSVTGRTSYREPFEPLLPNVDFVRFGDADELEASLSHQGEECCVILEPVQAEGGVVIPPAGYLREVERLCRHYGAFLIIDEIQTGLARLGQWWGIDREGVIPDMLLVGKALGGGVMPVSAMVASARVYEKLNKAPILHTSTFSGNPLSAVAACAAINVFEQENVVARARDLGEKLMTELGQTGLRDCPRLIREVRGEGLLIGIEFESEFLAGDFMIEMMHRNVIVSYSLNAHRVVRLTPPAFLTDSDVNWLSAACQDSLITLSERYPNFISEQV